MDTTQAISMPIAGNRLPKMLDGRRVVRTIAGLIVAALVIIGGLFLHSGFQIRAKCSDAEAAQVLDLAVDVGSPGQHRATLDQISDFPCQQYIALVPDLRDNEDAADVLAGLELTVTVADDGGVAQMVGLFPPQGLFPSPGIEGLGPDSPVIAFQRPMTVGRYSVLVDVLKPAPALAGRPVRLVSKYVLCGIERIGSTFGFVIGTTALTVGGIIGLLLWTTRRRVFM